MYTSKRVAVFIILKFRSSRIVVVDEGGLLALQRVALENCSAVSLRSPVDDETTGITSFSPRRPIRLARPGRIQLLMDIIFRRATSKSLLAHVRADEAMEKAWRIACSVIR